MFDEIQLLKSESVGSIIFLIGTVIFLGIIDKSLKYEEAKKQGIELPPQTFDLTKPTAFATFIFLIGIIIFAIVADLRLKNQEIKLANEATNQTDTPEKSIALGFRIAVIAYALIAFGAYRRSEEAGAQITNL